MDAPINPNNQNSQPSTGFSFPVTSVVDLEEVQAQSPVNPAAPQPQPQPVSPPLAANTPIPGQSPNPLPQTPFQPVPPINTMNFTEKPKSRTKDVILVGILLLLLAGAVFGFTRVRSLLSSATEDGCSPNEITEQDLTANSIVINFTTSEACKMQVAYGVDEILGLQMSEQTMATSHRIKLSPLMPSTPYKYQIRHDETKYEPTRGFLTMAISTVPTKTPTTAVPTRNLTPVPTAPNALVTHVPSSETTGGIKYTQTDFELHFGSVDPRFDTDKNGIVNIRDWQLYK